MSEHATALKRRQYSRSADTKARIFEAAMVQASEEGFQNISISAIARKAGVALGVLNYHFGSKQRLLTELMSSRMNDFVSRLTPRVEGEDFFSYERSLLATYLEFLHANPTYVRLAEEIRHHAPDLYSHGVKAHVAEIAKRIRSGIQMGDLRDMSEAEVMAQAYLLQGAYSFFDRFLENEHYPGDATLLAAVDNLLKNGLANQN